MYKNQFKFMKNYVLKKIKILFINFEPCKLGR